jgi:hypothetical protein
MQNSYSVARPSEYKKVAVPRRRYIPAKKRSGTSLLLWVSKRTSKEWSPSHAWKITSWHHARLSNRSESVFNDAVRHYAYRLRQVETSVDKAKVEKMLAEADENRSVIAALMDNEWAGLQLLVQLRANGKMSLSELVSKAREDSDTAAGTVARLVRGRAVLVDGTSFACTDRGLNLLQSLEGNTGVSLTPEA